MLNAALLAGGNPGMPNAQLAVNNNALRVTLTSGPCPTCTYENGVLGKTAFDFTGAVLEVRVRPANLAVPNNETTLLLDVAGVSGTFVMTASNMALRLSSIPMTDMSTIVPYVPQILAWRIRHDTTRTAFVFEVFYEGKGWSEERVVVSSLPATSTRVQLFARNVMNGAGGEGVFDEVVLYGPNCVQMAR